MRFRKTEGEEKEAAKEELPKHLKVLIVSFSLTLLILITKIELVLMCSFLFHSECHALYSKALFLFNYAYQNELSLIY